MVAAVRSQVDLIAEIRQRSDHENSDFVTDAELASWIDQSAAALLDIIADYAGADAFVAYQLLTTVPGTDTYALDANVYRITGVDVRFGNRWIDIDRAGFADRNLFQGRGWSGPRDTRYMLHGRSGGVANIMFVPAPPAVFDVRVWYTPLQSSLDATHDLVSFNGWDEYVICDVCAKVLEKKEADSRGFLARKAEAQARVVQAAKALDSARALRMRDVGASCTDDDEPLWWN